MNRITQTYCTHNLSFHLNRAIQIEEFEKAAFRSQRPQQGAHTHRLERLLRDITAHRGRGDAQSNTKATTDTGTPELTRPRRMITTSSSQERPAPEPPKKRMQYARRQGWGSAPRHRYTMDASGSRQSQQLVIGRKFRVFGLRPVGQAHLGTRGVVDPTFAQSEISALARELSKKAGRNLRARAMRSSGRGKACCGARQAEPEPG